MIFQVRDIGKVFVEFVDIAGAAKAKQELDGTKLAFFCVPAPLMVCGNYNAVCIP